MKRAFFVLGFGLSCLGFGSENRREAVLSEAVVYEPGPYPSCHASTVVETSTGRILAAWFAGEGESKSDVSIYLSEFQKGRWTKQREIANGIQHEDLRYASWNPVLYQPENGDLILFYKVGPWPAAWWGMMRSSKDEGETWENPYRLPEGVLGPIKNKPIVLENGTLVCGSSVEDPGSEGKGWQVQIELSEDMGNTWKVVGPLNQKSEFNAIQPTILKHRDQRLQILCRTMHRGIATSWSEDGGHSWTPLQPTGLRQPNSGFDSVSLKDGRHLLVANLQEEAKVVQQGESDRCPLNVSLSEDGVNWEIVLVLEEEPLPHGYAYPAVIQSEDGLVHITYTWNREKIKHVVIDPSMHSK